MKTVISIVKFVLLISTISIPHVAYSWSENVVVTEHNAIKNKITLKNGLMFLLPRDFRLKDDIVSDLINKSEDPYFFLAEIALNGFSFVQVQITGMPNDKINQENLTLVNDDALENFFGLIKSNLQISMEPANIKMLDFKGEKRVITSKIFLVTKNAEEHDDTKNINYGKYERLRYQYMYFDHPNSFIVTMNGLRSAEKELDRVAQSLIKSIVYPK